MTTTRIFGQPMKRLIVGTGAVILLGFLAACGPQSGAKSESDENTRSVSFGNLVDGQTVTSPFTVEMTARNLVVEPAAKGITDGHGHFHILVDVPAPEAPAAIPFDEQHIHFGGGQTETTLDLAPGEHTLTLLFAQGNHVPYSPQIAQSIRVLVKAPE